MTDRIPVTIWSTPNTIKDQASIRHNIRGYFPILSSAVVFDIERPSMAGKKNAMTAPAVAPTNWSGIQIDFADTATA